MRRLTYYHATAFARPCASPWIGEIVGRFAPSEHRYHCEDRFAELAGIDRFFHPQDWFVPAALTDYT